MKTKSHNNPYAHTDAGRRALKDSLFLKIEQNEINVLSMNASMRISAGLSPYNANFMFLWVEGSGTQFADWRLDVQETCEYKVTVLVQGNDCRLTVTSGTQSVSRQVQNGQWDRVFLGTVVLIAGMNRLRLELDSKSRVKVSALEIVRPATEQQLLADAMSFRNSPDWFKDAGYGLMFQWTNRTTPPEGSISKWEQKVNDFDIDTLVDLVEDAGASFVVWSVTWGQQYISAPIKALDEIIPGRTTKRDLLGELAERLHNRGVRLIFYYHYGYDCYHSTDPEWMQAAGGYLQDKAMLFENIIRIVSAIGQRNGDALDGWFFDGGQRFYDTHFDGAGTDGISSAPFRRLGFAARSGNEERVLCYNPWVLPRLTEYQDYFAGEGMTGYEDVHDGVFTIGGQQGLMGFCCTTLEQRWGHIDEDKPIAPPCFTSNQLIKIIKKAKANRYPIAINLEMYENGAVSPRSAKLMNEVRLKLAMRQAKRLL